MHESVTTNEDVLLDDLSIKINELLVSEVVFVKYTILLGITFYVVNSIVQLIKKTIEKYIKNKIKILSYRTHKYLITDISLLRDLGDFDVVCAFLMHNGNLYSNYYNITYTKADCVAFSYFHDINIEIINKLNELPMFLFLNSDTINKYIVDIFNLIETYEHIMSKKINYNNFITKIYYVPVKENKEKYDSDSVGIITITNASDKYNFERKDVNILIENISEKLVTLSKNVIKE